MSQPLDDLSAPARIAAIRANQFEYFRYLGRSPQAELYDSPQLAWSLTGVPHPFLNNVFHTQLTAGNVDDVIACTLSYFTSRNVTHFSWWTEPGSQPADLAEHLLAHGLAYTDGGPGMAVDLLALNEDVAAPRELTIGLVADRKALQQWSDALVVGFGLLESEGAAFDLYAGLGFNLPLRSYVGCLNGEPVATVQLFLGAGVAGVYCVSTVPEARRRGIGAAMTLAALREARDMGYRAGILTSSSMGFSVYRRLGFEELCKMSHFYLAPRSV